MIAATEALDAWWPPTLSPSRLGRRWLALWIVQLDSHRTLRSSSRSSSIGSRRGWAPGDEVVRDEDVGAFLAMAVSPHRQDVQIAELYAAATGVARQVAGVSPSPAPRKS